MLDNNGMISIHITDVIMIPVILIILGITIAMAIIKDELSNNLIAKRTLNLLWGIAIIYLILLTSSVIFKNPLINFDKNQYSLLGAIGIILSAFIASMSVMVSTQNTNRLDNEKKKYDKSEFYLEKVLLELENVFELLKDRNNDRVTWILASRILTLVIDLSKKITEENHKMIYSLQSFQLKHKLREVFEYEEKKSLPLAFYAGLENWQKESIEAARKEIQSPIIKNELDLESIIVIFDFISFPNPYTDPLTKIVVPEDKDLEEWQNNGSTNFIKSGAVKYIKEKRNKIF